MGAGGREAMQVFGRSFDQTMFNSVCISGLVVAVAMSIAVGSSAESTPEYLEARLAGLPARAPPSFTPTADLPPLLTFNNGSEVSTAAQWWDQPGGRRAEVQQLLYEHILGEPPPRAAWPRLHSSTGVRGGAVSQYVRLNFTTPFSTALSFFVELICPATSASATATRALVLTQWNHRQWALRGATRGHCAVVYPGADVRDASDALQAAYAGHGNFTWAKILRRAVLASITIDWALGNVPNLNSSRLAITGHSRNGKQSLVAAAIDQRITAVVGSSPGAPIASPWRFTSAQFFGETVRFVSPERGWWVQSAAQYLGREDMLPIDGHGVLALIAPRHALLATAHNDHESDITWANARSIKATRAVYALLGAPVDNVRAKFRPGDHHGFDDIGTYYDWFDVAWGGGGPGTGAGGAPLARELQEVPLHSFNWSAWNASLGDDSDVRRPPPRSAAFDERLRWLLGPPPGYGRSPGSPFGEETPGFTYIGTMLGQDNTLSTKLDNLTQRVPLSFGDYHVACAYYPSNASKATTLDDPLPVVLWLHPLSYASGFVPTAMHNDPEQGAIYQNLAANGFFVVTWDQVGFGLRVPENEQFYARYPHSSKMARAVDDVSAAIDFVQCTTAAARGAGGGAPDARCSSGNGPAAAYPERLEALPFVDASRVYVVGYSFGGAVGLMAAALDARVAGVASFSGFTPMRSDSNARPTGGNQRWYDWHATLPRLGLFQPSKPNESNGFVDVPVDYDEVLAAVAPRAALVYAPLHDRDANATEVAATVSAASAAWSRAGARANLTFEQPADYNRFAGPQLAVAREWLQQQAFPAA